mmetsp:Transcript_24075/g.59731  ORF Transcript_24075/g.59731 Transcript_24075/m.59731 type:complete len:89 (-) Transcript_24075:2521-2787(-)
MHIHLHHLTFSQYPTAAYKVATQKSAIRLNAPEKEFIVELSSSAINLLGGGSSCEAGALISGRGTSVVGGNMTNSGGGEGGEGGIGNA